MSDNHTPGPWHCHDAFGRKEGANTIPQSHFAYAVSDNDGFAVAHCTGPLVTMTSERSFNNARLIAAAPRLLNACRIALTRLQRAYDSRIHLTGITGGQLPAEITELKNAIAQATGTKAP